jgi:predicted nucleotide-binding protein
MKQAARLPGQGRAATASHRSWAAVDAPALAFHVYTRSGGIGMGAKPRMFIGSSTETLDVARTLQEQLQHTAIVNVWDQSLFLPGDVVIDRLTSMVTEFDFGTFIFGADDTAVSRGKRYLTARDNVILELGLFVSRLGRERSFIVVQRTPDRVHLPSDLQGVVTTQFDWPEETPYDNYRELHAVLGPAAQSIRAAISSRGQTSKELEPLSAGMLFIALCLKRRTHNLLELTRKFMDFQRDTERVASHDATAYAGKAAKYACQCLQALGLASPTGGDEFYLTPVGREIVASGKLQTKFPTAVEVDERLHGTKT